MSYIIQLYLIFSDKCPTCLLFYYSKVLVLLEHPKYLAVQFETIPFKSHPKDCYCYRHPVVIGVIHQLRVLNPYPPSKTIRDYALRLGTKTGGYVWECNPPEVFNADGDLPIKCELVVMVEIVPLELVQGSACGGWGG